VANESRGDGQEKVIQIRRCACVVKGGRRFTFTALVVLGDKRGKVGWGYGKASEVPQAVEKAVKTTNRNSIVVSLADTTIPHTVEGRYGAARVVLIPALPGTGVMREIQCVPSSNRPACTTCLPRAAGRPTR